MLVGRSAVLVFLHTLTIIPAQGESIRDRLLRQDVTARFSLDQEEDIAYLEVFAESKDTGEVFPYSEGRIELWRENHVLMMNVSDTSELSVSVRNSNTYLWASVYDKDGRWIAESNVLHTGYRAGVWTTIHEAVAETEWVDGEQIEFGFLIQLREEFDSYMISKGVIVIDNQTVGMVSIEQTFTRASPSQTFTYHHHGEVEVGRHTLSLALLYPGQGTPCVLSPQVWFEVRAKRLERFSFESWKISDVDTSLIDENCVNGFVACVVKDSRQGSSSTSLLLLSPPSTLSPPPLPASPTAALLDASLVRKLKKIPQVSENFLRAGRAFQCVGQLK
eukprot:607348-Hanusia_phi.AAC.1